MGSCRWRSSVPDRRCGCPGDPSRVILMAKSTAMTKVCSADAQDDELLKKIVNEL